MWKCSLPAKEAGKILQLLMHAPISVSVLCFVSVPLKETLGERCVCFCRRAVPLFTQRAWQGRHVCVWFFEGQGFFFVFPQRFSNLSDGRTPLWVPLLLACWKRVWYSVMVLKKCALFPKVRLFLLNNCNYLCFGVAGSL